VKSGALGCADVEHDQPSISNAFSTCSILARHPAIRRRRHQSGRNDRAAAANEELRGHSPDLLSASPVYGFECGTESIAAAASYLDEHDHSRALDDEVDLAEAAIGKFRSINA